MRNIDHAGRICRQAIVMAIKFVSLTLHVSFCGQSGSFRKQMGDENVFFHTNALT